MQGIFQKENTDKALKYGIYRHLPTYEKIIRNLVSFYIKKWIPFTTFPSFTSRQGIILFVNICLTPLSNLTSFHKWPYP
ncbi:hypothetical protein DXD61_01485 [Eubacterium sp. TM06-47]|nr:hypothetical protein DXD61_01485 [Eubacterium sp. TM06-47]